MIATKKEKGRIRHEGMGGALNPPGHPEHTLSVETDLRRRPENRGSMSLSYCAEQEYMDDGIRAQCRKILKDWSENRMPLDSPEVQEWVHQVLGYYKGCYRSVTAEENDPQAWDAAHLHITKEWNPMEQIDKHAGVHLIRKYYPEFTPSAEDFQQAYWGTKPDYIVGA